jgi:hypothetical protein
VPQYHLSLEPHPDSLYLHVLLPLCPLLISQLLGLRLLLPLPQHCLYDVLLCLLPLAAELEGGVEANQVVPQSLVPKLAAVDCQAVSLHLCPPGRRPAPDLQLLQLMLLHRLPYCQLPLVEPPGIHCWWAAVADIVILHQTFLPVHQLSCGVVPTTSQV